MKLKKKRHQYQLSQARLGKSTYKAGKLRELNDHDRLGSDQCLGRCADLTLPEPDYNSMGSVNHATERRVAIVTLVMRSHNQVVPAADVQIELQIELDRDDPLWGVASLDPTGTTQPLETRPAEQLLYSSLLLGCLLYCLIAFPHNHDTHPLLAPPLCIQPTYPLWWLIALTIRSLLRHQAWTWGRSSVF
jgi:hypothetical protein